MQFQSVNKHFKKIDNRVIPVKQIQKVAFQI